MIAIVIIVITMALGGLAAWRVRSAFSHWSGVAGSSGLTGAETAAAILRASGISNVQIVPVGGHLTDHYDPINKVLALSETVYGSRSIAAQSVAAHECGHALQHAQAYAPLHLRMGLVSVQGIASNMVMWLPLLGGFLHILAPRTMFFLMALGWGAILLFNLVTLPVEYDASARAKRVLVERGMVQPGTEATGVSRVLNAAGLTYVAAFLTSLAWALYYILPYLLGGRRSDD